MTMLRRWIDRRIQGVRNVLSADLIIQNEELEGRVEQLEADLDAANARVELQRKRIVQLEEQVEVVDPIANGLDNQRHYAAQQRIRDLEAEVDKLRRICRGD